MLAHAKVASATVAVRILNESTEIYELIKTTDCEKNFGEKRPRKSFAYKKRDVSEITGTARPLVAAGSKLIMEFSASLRRLDAPTVKNHSLLV